MAYTSKFQALADAARARVVEIAPSQVDALLQAGAIALDIRDKEEHDADHMTHAIHVSRGKLEMNIESAIHRHATRYGIHERLFYWRWTQGVSLTGCASVHSRR